MIKKISICGKGGSGKSVITSLFAKVLRDKGFNILVVDTDESNIGLHRMLNLEDAPQTLTQSFGGRKEVVKYWNENRLKDLVSDTIKRKDIVTKDRIGLLAVGKIIEGGGGCACPLSAITKAFLKIYEPKDDEILLLDTDAGVEHFGRGNEKNIDAVVIVVDPSYESVELAERSKKLALELGIPDERFYILTNKVDVETNKVLIKSLKEKGLEKNFVGSVGFDPVIQESSLFGRPMIEYGGSAVRDIEKIVDKILFQHS